MTTRQLLPKFLKQPKFLIILPLLVIPGLFIAFHLLDGGAAEKKEPFAGQITGFNTTLPPALFDDKENSMTKLGFYKKADEDSLKRRQSRQLDPYQDSLKQSPSVKAISSSRNSSFSTGLTPAEDPKAEDPKAEDPKAEELLKKLEQIKQSVRKPRSSPGKPAGASLTEMDLPVTRPPEALTLARLQQMLQGRQRFQERAADTTPPDPQLERLNKMLDKVIQIQHAHAGEVGGTALPGPDTVEDTGSATTINRAETMSAAPPPNTLSAVVEEDQTLVSGTTIALRLIEEVMINGIRIPPNQLVYGLASINNDRMLITINSIRHDRSIYTTALQVYDMDGLPGIHIPGMLSREVAKQSADQGIGELNLATFSPSIGAQAANAGIQATKSLLSRKIRLVRVSVPGGYRVLLRNIKGSGVSMVSSAPALSGTARLHDGSRGTPVIRIDDPTRALQPDSTRALQPDSVRALQPDSVQDILPDSVRDILPDPMGATLPDPIKALASETFPPFLHRSVSEGKVELILQGVYLRDGLLWLSFRLKNQSPIGYDPEYTRCLIRERKKMKRTAIQEIPLQPVIERLPPMVTGGAEQVMNLGFRPFTLSKDKKLVLQVAERDGGRELNLSIPSKILLKAK